MINSLIRKFNILEEQGIVKYGWSEEKISHLIKIDENGHYLGFISLNIEKIVNDKNEKMTNKMLVPIPLKRNDKPEPNFLYDNPEYILGMDKDGKATDKAQKYLNSFKEQILNLNIDIKEISSLKLFYENNEINQIPKEELSELLQASNITFMVNKQIILNLKELQDYYSKKLKEKESTFEIKRCLCCNEIKPIADKHNSLKGIYGALSSGHNIISYNAEYPAFEKYNNKGMNNSPICIECMNKYTTVFNLLTTNLDYTCGSNILKITNKNNYIRVGDYTILFWSEDSNLENAFSLAFDFNNLFEDESSENTIKTIFEKALKSEEIDIKDLNLEQDFYLCIIAPNVARLSIQGFYKNKFNFFLKNILDFQESMLIKKKDKTYMTRLFQLKNEINSKNGSIKKSLNIELVKAMILGQNLPQVLYNDTLSYLSKHTRVLQEKRKNNEKIVFLEPKLSIIKSYYMKKNKVKEDPLMLNTENKKPMYLLGRALAIMEVNQLRSLKDKNDGETITDRYMRSLMQSPKTTLPLAIKLYKAHNLKLKKFNPGAAIYFEKLLTDIISDLEVLPVSTNTNELSEFIFGYYAQKKDLFTKKINSDEDTSDENNNE